MDPLSSAYQKMLLDLDSQIKDPLTVLKFTLEEMKEGGSIHKIQSMLDQIRRIRDVLTHALEKNQNDINVPEEKSQREQIVRKNDSFRKNIFIIPTRTQLKCSPQVKAALHCYDILQAVADFDNFTLQDDPSREHRIGIVHVHEETYCFKIDYRDAHTRKWSDPLDPGTLRVMTILSTKEYSTKDGVLNS